MKKLLLIVFLFSFVAFGQVNLLLSGTFANNGEKTAVLNLANSTKVDSVVFSIHYRDSIDVRTHLFQRGKQGETYYITRASGDSVTTTYSSNNSAGKYAVVATFTSNDLKGVDRIHVFAKAHSSGNAAALNGYKIFATVYRK